MRKILALILAITVNAYAVPPVSVDSEQSSVGNYVQNTKLPNEQATQLTSRNTRIETGNQNLLKNPSFEHMTLGFGWTATNATPSFEATDKVEGKKSLKLVLSAALTAYQDSTINASSLVGLQGVASVKVKNNGVTGLKACVRNAGTTSSTLCVNIPSDNTWKHISIPFIMTATSNGIALTSTGTSGTVYVDDAFVGTSAPFQDVSGAKLMGTVTISGCSNPWSSTSTTYADFSAQTGCSYAVTGSAVAPQTRGSWGTPTNLPGISFASLPAGDYKIEAEVAMRNSTAGADAYFQFWDGVNTAREQSMGFGTGSQNSVISTSQQSISYSTSQSNITLSLRTKVSSGTSQVYASSTYTTVIKLWYFPPATKIYSQASQDYAWTSYTPTLGAGYGTVTELKAYHSRKGQMLRVMGSFRIGTAAAATGEVYLPSGLAIDSSYFRTSQSNILGFGSGFRRIINAGGANTDLIYRMGFDGTNTDRLFLTSSSGGDTAGGTFTKTNVNSAFNNSDVISFYYEVPISGWSDYGVIVGSFAGIEKCANDYECTDTFSAQISSTGVVSNENVDWINGNCSFGSAGIADCTYNTNLKDGTSALSSKMNCDVTYDNASTTAMIVRYDYANSTTSLARIRLATAGNAPTSDSFILTCHKGSQDYKPKTAKVASSIGVPTVPGITTQAIDTFSFSYGTTNATTACTASPCSYLNQIGNVVSSVTRSSTGVYVMNLNKTYSALKCNGNANGTGMVAYTAMRCESCSTLTFSSVNTSSASVADTYGTLVCQGSY